MKSLGIKKKGNVENVRYLFERENYPGTHIA